MAGRRLELGAENQPCFTDIVGLLPSMDLALTLKE